jgi:hypothetical protein
LGANNDNYITTGASGITVFRAVGTERMRIDASGSVGIGVVPSTIWSSSYDALQIGLGGSMYAHAAAGSNMHMAANSVYEGTAPNYYDKYLTSSTASKYVQDSGLHIWSTAASGTAGDAITWSEAMRIDASGNVLVGTTDSATYNLTSGGGTAIWANGLTSSAKASALVSILNRTGTDGEIQEFRKNGTTVGGIGTTGGDLIIGTGDTGLYFYDAATSVIPWKVSTNASSDNYSDLGHPSYRWKNLYLGGGVVFGATGGDVSSKTLDDYEEGTFTAALTAVGGGTITLGSDLMRYTKIGRVVTVSGLIICSAISSPTGDLSLTGLPFTVNNNTDGEYSGLSTGSIHIQALASTITGNPQLNIPNNATQISIDGFNGTTRTSIAANISATTQIRICATYTT